MGPNDNRPAISGATVTNYSTLDYNGYREKKKSRIKYRWRLPVGENMNHIDGSELTSFEMKSLKEFTQQTGYEEHGVELDYDCFENVVIPDPQKRGHVYPVAGYDFRLKKGSKAIDAGCVLPNITDGFQGDAPDLGALEHGNPLPHYGPRINR